MESLARFGPGASTARLMRLDDVRRTCVDLQWGQGQGRNCVFRLVQACNTRYHTITSKLRSCGEGLAAILIDVTISSDMPL